MLAPKRNETPLEYWISLWPTAPLFGVKWRFEGVAPGVALFQPLDAAARMARDGAEEAKRVVERQSAAAADAIESRLREAAAMAETLVNATADAAVQASVLATEPDPAPVVEAPAAPDAVAAPPEADGADADQDDAEAIPHVPFAGVVPPTVLYAEPPPVVDDLKLIRGVGPKLESQLHQMGIFRFDQIAGFTPENLAWVDANLSTFKGRPLRDDWVAQARALL